MRVFILALLGAHVADGAFLASQQTLMSKSALEIAASPNTTERPSKYTTTVKPADTNTAGTSKTYSGKVATPDQSMAKDEDEYKPLLETARDRMISPKPVIKSKPASPKYPIIAACHHNLAKVFGMYTDCWWKDWKLWIGLACWLSIWAKWLIHGYDEVYYQRAMHAFGVNIIILHLLQYAGSTLSGMLEVCALLIAQTLFQSFWWYKADLASHELDEFDCDTLYLDLALPVEQIVVLFVAQFGVWWFYMTSILGNFNFENVNYLFWVWAYLVMQMTMIFNRGADSVLGNPFPLHDVDRIFKHCTSASFTLLDEDGLPGESFRISKANILMRGITGFFCNAILRDIMAYTIPLMLMGFSEPMDFVVYCVGVNFICTLDDMSERKYTMKEVKGEEEDCLS